MNEKLGLALHVPHWSVQDLPNKTFVATMLMLPAVDHKLFFLTTLVDVCNYFANK